MENQFYRVETKVQGVGTVYVSAPDYVTCIRILINTKDLPYPIAHESVEGMRISNIKILGEIK